MENTYFFFYYFVFIFSLFVKLLLILSASKPTFHFLQKAKNIITKWIRSASAQQQESHCTEGTPLATQWTRFKIPPLPPGERGEE